MNLVDREREVAAQVTPLLREYFVLGAQEHNLFTRCANASTGATLSSSGATMLTVAARLLGDLRVCQWAAEHGYAIQAGSIAASIHEIAFSAAYIGDSDERATAWRAHENARKAYPPSGHASAINDVLKRLGLPEAQCNREYGIYGELCLAKHGNPLLQARYGYSVVGEEELIEQVPYFSADTVAIARFALFHAERAISMLLTTLLQTHFFQQLNTDIVADFRAITEELTRLGTRDGLYDIPGDGTPPVAPT